MLLLFGSYMAIMNWAVFVNNYVLKKQWTSAVPLIGGVAGAVGVLSLPIDGTWRYSWIPLLLDWGSIPVIMVSIICKCMPGKDHVNGNGGEGRQ